MAITLPGGGGLSPGFPDIKSPAAGVLAQLAPGPQLSQPGNTISYGGSPGTPMMADLGMGNVGVSGPEQDSLGGLLMLLGLAQQGQLEGAIPGELMVSQTPQAGGIANGEPIPASEKDMSVRPTDENLQGRPPGDNRSAEEIIDANPVLKNLGNQKDIKRDELKERFGDWTDANKDPESRADAAYNMARVLNSIKGLNCRDGSDRPEIAANGKIEGITKSGDARHGSEAGVLKDIAEQGMKMLPEDNNLPPTSDTHVRNDGTIKDNFQWGMGEFGKILSNIPILKSVAAPVFNNIGEARNAGEVFTGGLSGLAEGAMSAARGPVGWGITAATDTVEIAIENGGKDKKEPPPFS